VKWLLEKGTLVICAGGGGIPTMYDPGKERWLTGIEAVIDKDLASELLAREVEADLFVIATDVNGVYVDWGKPEQRMIGQVTADELRSYSFPAGSMGPKVAAAIQFVEMTGKRAAIGSLADIGAIVAGTAGTNVVATKG
jgi:carbamate kinase